MADKPLAPIRLERAKSYYHTLMGWDAGAGMQALGYLRQRN